MRFYGNRRHAGGNVAARGRLVAWLATKNLHVVNIDAQNHSNNCLFLSFKMCIGTRKVKDTKTGGPAAELPDMEGIRALAVDYIEHVLNEGDAHPSGMYEQILLHIEFEVRGDEAFRILEQA